MDLVRHNSAKFAIAFSMLLCAEVGQASEPTGGPRTMRCAVAYSEAIQRPWLKYATERFLEVDIRNLSVVDRTVRGAPYKFKIISEDAVWIVATNEDPKFLEGYLDYAEHQPKLAKVSINRRNLEISLEVRTNPHVDPTPDGAFWQNDPHVATIIYSGTCSVVKRRI